MRTGSSQLKSQRCVIMFGERHTFNYSAAHFHSEDHDSFIMLRIIARVQEFGKNLQYPAGLYLAHHSSGSNAQRLNSLHAALHSYTSILGAATPSAASIHSEHNIAP